MWPASFKHLGPEAAQDVLGSLAISGLNGLGKTIAFFRQPSVVKQFSPNRQSCARRRFQIYLADGTADVYDSAALGKPPGPRKAVIGIPI